MVGEARETDHVASRPPVGLSIGVRAKRAGWSPDLLWQSSRQLSRTVGQSAGWLLIAAGDRHVDAAQACNPATQTHSQRQANATTSQTDCRPIAAPLSTPRYRVFFARHQCYLSTHSSYDSFTASSVHQLTPVTTITSAPHLRDKTDRWSYSKIANVTLATTSCILLLHYIYHHYYVRLNKKMAQTALTLSQSRLIC